MGMLTNNISKIVLKRTLPRNLNDQDTALFQKETFYESRQSFIDKRFFVFFNFNSFTAFNRHSFFKKNNLKTNNVPFKTLGFHRVRLCFDEYLFLDNWSLNYFHWFTDVIPKILYAIKKRSTVRILMPGWLYNRDYVYQSLSLIDGVVVEVFSKTALIINAKIVNRGYTSGNYDEGLIQQERGVFFKMNAIKNEVPCKRIFVFRSVEAKRGILNFEELAPVLKKYAITIIDFSNYSWIEQYSLAVNADILIGVHGAGLTNMLFMKENSNILELRRKDDDHNNCYFSLAAACKHKYWYQLCDVDDPSIETQQNSFYVDVDVFENNIAQILSTV